MGPNQKKAPAELRQAETKKKEEDPRSDVSPEVVVVRGRRGGFSLAGVLSLDILNCSSEPVEEATDTSDELDMEHPKSPEGTGLK